MDVFNELPIYSVEINDSADGIEYVALTSKPAIQVNFLKFSNPLQFSTDDEKRIISGPIMLANTPLYRRDDKLGEYYVLYTPETIDVMATKMLFDKRTTAVNIEHLEGSEVSGVILKELYIKNSSRGISPSEFDDVPDGSLFATYKVENPVIWDAIKAGKFTGFSIEGLFSFKQDSEEDTYKELIKSIKKIKRVK